MGRDVVAKAKWKAELRTMKKGTRVWSVDAGKVVSHRFHQFADNVEMVSVVPDYDDDAEPPPAPGVVQVHMDDVFDNEQAAEEAAKTR